MKLRQIQLQGFKSFVDRTVINFPDDITCVVGPNGCGKSNLADAIRWSLGEQSSKSLRGASMDDVIFHGADEAEGVGMAEVAIVFDNSQKLCPPEYMGFAELQVTRRLFRTGESEYFINREPCRLKDITDLFLGSGVGTRAYSIIEQGKIESIISMKPEQRRGLIEEAAGVSKYRVRRQEAARKMEATRDNLARLRDIVGELKRQMNSLNRQAKKAERYKEYRAELNRVELELACKKALGLTAEREAFETKTARLLDRESELAATVGRIEAELEAMRTELLRLERELSAWRTEALEAGREVEKHDRAQAMLEQERENLGRRIERLDRERDELDQREKLLHAEIQGLKTEDQGLEAAIADAETRLEEALRRREETRTEYQELSDATAVLEKHALQLKADVDKLVDRLEWSERRKAELDRRLEAMAQRQDDLAQRLERQARTNLEFNEKLYRMKKEGADLERELGGRQTELTEARTGLAVADDRLKRIGEELTATTLKRDHLLELERNFEGYQRGIKAIMDRRDQQAREGRNGTYGLIAEVVKTAPEYELALEAVLGERLQTIFVKSAQHGLEHIDFLKRSGAGRGAFAPLESTGPTSAVVPSQLGELGAQLLVEKVTAEDRFASTAQAMIGDALVVDDLERALQVRAEIGATNPLVTRDGVLADRLGLLSGGSADSFAGVLAKKRERGELTEAIDLLAAQRETASAEAAGLRAKIGDLEKEFAARKEASHRLEIDKNNIMKDLRQGIDAHNSIQREQEAIAGELGAAQADLTRLAAEAEEARGVIERDREAGAKLEAEMVARKAALQEKRALRDAEAQRCTELQVAAAALREKHVAQRRHAERLDQAVAEITASVSRRLGEVGETQSRLTALAGELELVIGAKNQAIELARAKEAGADAARNGYEAQAARLRERETGLKAAYKERSSTQEERMAAELSLGQLKIQWEGLTENVQDKFGRPLESVIEERRGEVERDDFPFEDRQAQRQELRDKIERMGDVNPTAIEEFEEISARVSFLTNQEADLISALENLEEAIAKINSAYKRSFKQTFEEVNQKFQETFPRLFNGGKASLLLTDPEDLLEAGVEIMAQPPGKKMNSIVLLSGGEKALTSAALILALFLVKPSPFCLLDEVDAALDDVNVDRFNDLLTELATKSQLIMITHNKRTMELADALYGVTMEKKGVSKLVSVRFKPSETAHAAAQDP